MKWQFNTEALYYMYSYLFVAAQLGSKRGHLLGGRSSVHLNLDQLLHEAVALHTQLLAFEPARDKLR